MEIPPADYQAIQELLARYCIALDEHDIDGWVALFTPDARYEVFGQTFEGHDRLRRLISHAPRGLHLGGVPVIVTFDGARATTKQNLLFAETVSGEMRRTLYTDRLIRTSEGWRIAERRCQFIVADGLSDRPDP